MPEGPEIYINSKFIYKYFINKFIINITSNTKSIVNIPKKSRIINVFSHGKIIIIQTIDFYIHIHFGITGWFVLNKPKIYKYILHFSNKDVYLQDTRKFSSINILNQKENIEKILTFGVDILSSNFTLQYFKYKLQNSNKNICIFLLDQKNFAGLGNYIKNESLYLSKISPFRKASDLNNEEINLLFNKIKFISFSNLVDWHNDYNIKINDELKLLLPKKLDIPYEFYIFEREKDNLNNNVLINKKHCGRRTYWVKNIQK